MTKLSSLLLLLLAASAGIAPCTAIKKRYSREVRGGKRKLMSTYGWDGTGGIVDVSPTEEPTHGADFFWSGGGEEVAPPPVRVPTTPRPSSRRYVTMDPTRRPTPAPSNRPTPKPTKQPTNHPTPNPTNQPTNRPTPKPVNQLYIPPGTSWGGSTVEIIQTAKPTRRPTSNPTVSSAWGGGYTGIDNNDVPSINQDFIDYDVNSSSGSNGITHEESVPISTVDENGNLQVVVEVGGGGEYITIDVGGDGGSETYIVDYPGVGQSVEEGVATIATVATAGTSVTDSSTGLFDDGFFGSQEYVDQDVTDVIGFTTTGATSSVSGVGTTESTTFLDGIFGEDTGNFVGDVVDGIFGENNTMTSTKSTDMVMNTGLDKPLDILDRICEAWKNDEVYSSENPVDIEFAYEIAVNQDFSVDNIVQSLDEVLGQRVGKEVLNCDGLDFELSDDANFDVELDDFVSMSMPQVSGGSDTTNDDLRDGRLLVQSGDVQGIGNSPDFVTGQECSYFTLETGNLPPNTECHVVNGLITLYLNSTDRGTVAEEVHALLEVSMNKESSGYLDLIQGLEGVHYNGVPSIDPVVIRSIGSDESSEPISPIWIGGIAMISVGSIAVIAAIVFFIRKKNSDTESPERFSKLPDDTSFDSTKDETAETKDFFVDIMINSDEDSFGNTLGNEAVLGEFGVSPSTARPGDIPNYMKDTQGF